MFWFLIGVVTTLVVILFVVLLLGENFLLYLVGRLPWIHRVEEEIPEGNTPVAVLCSGKGRISAGEDTKESQECCIERIFSVPNRKLRVGCHGRYTIGQAQFFSRTVGGDPICGGGIKHTFLPWLSELWVRIRSFLALKMGKPVKGFVLRRRDGEIVWGELYVGDLSDIKEFSGIPAEHLLAATLTPLT